MRLPVAFTVLLCTGLLVSCSNSEQDAEDATEKTAEAIPSKVADLTWSGDRPDQVAKAYDEVVAGMGDLEPKVEVDEVTVADGTATAQLSWNWPVADGDESWTYQSELKLKKSSDDWLPVWSPAVVEPSLKDGEVLSATTMSGDRGTITGAGGAVIVKDRAVRRYGINRAEVSGKQAADSARRLADLVGIDVAPYVKTVEGAGPKAFVEAIVYRLGEVPADVEAGADGITGLQIADGLLPLAPTREFAAPILGRVGPVTAEMVKEDPDAYQAGDVAGVSGLQARYDDQLRGREGMYVEAGEPDTAEPRELYRQPSGAGKPLATTLDIGLQQTAERLLGDITPGSALVAIRPSDGAILTAANGPGNNGQNYATYGQFAPGSTFKVASTLAMLRAGLRPDSTVPCTSTIEVDGKQFENYDDYPRSALGQVPLRTAIANSCNTAVISQAEQLESDDLTSASGGLGLGVDHDLGFPAFFGEVPSADPGPGRAAAMIGQGTVLASPMALAAMIASTQEGRVVVPHLLPGVTSEPTADQAKQSVTGAEARQLQSILRAAVTEGSARGLADVQGPPVIAKTGTAEFEQDGELRTHGWMVAAQGDLAVAVFVELGQSGSTAAGPVLEAFLRAAQQ